MFTYTFYNQYNADTTTFLLLIPDIEYQDDLIQIFLHLSNDTYWLSSDRVFWYGLAMYVKNSYPHEILIIRPNLTNELMIDFIEKNTYYLNFISDQTWDLFFSKNHTDEEFNYLLFKVLNRVKYYRLVYMIDDMIKLDPGHIQYKADLLEFLDILLYNK